MPGRGRGLSVIAESSLRRPGKDDCETLKHDKVLDLINRVKLIKSPDDLQIQSIAAEIKNVSQEDDLKPLITKLCDHGLTQTEAAPVIAAICGATAHHQAGSIKVRSLLFQRVQMEYSKRQEVASSDREGLVTSAMFLGEIFHHVRSENGTPFQVLAEPVTTYLIMILGPHLQKEENPNLDKDVSVVAKQLLQNGCTLYDLQPDGTVEVVRQVTEVFCRHNLTPATRLNLIAALSTLWPSLAASQNPRTMHAVLAAKLGVSLHI